MFAVNILLIVPLGMPVKFAGYVWLGKKQMRA
jgi:hypothetical protein